MESVIHNDYRQQSIPSEEACSQYRAYLAQLEALIADQEDAVTQARSLADAAQLSQARTTLWRLLTKRQGVLDALAGYEMGKQAQHSA